MGVPQGRERVFFVCLRKDLAEPFMKINNLFENKPYIDLDFNERPILAKEVVTKGNRISENTSYHESRFGDVLYNPEKVFSTLVTRNRYFYDLEHYVSNETYLKVGTYPMDYDFRGTQPLYLTGMSVPPLMTAQIASRIYEQWLSKI